MSNNKGWRTQTAKHKIYYKATVINSVMNSHSDRSIKEKRMSINRSIYIWSLCLFKDTSNSHAGAIEHVQDTLDNPVFSERKEATPNL